MSLSSFSFTLDVGYNTISHFQKKEKEIQELKEKLKVATESETKEKLKLKAVQDALDKLAEEEEERNAQKAKAAAQESKKPTDSKKH